MSDWYARNNVRPPEQIKHGLSIDDIVEKLKPLELKNWRQEGNRLIADSDVGEVVNPLPANYILTGTDDKGLPIFKKL